MCGVHTRILCVYCICVRCAYSLYSVCIILVLASPQDSQLFIEQHKSGLVPPSDVDFEDCSQGVKAASSENALNMPKVRIKDFFNKRKHKVRDSFTRTRSHSHSHTHTYTLVHNHKYNICTHSCTLMKTKIHTQTHTLRHTHTQHSNPTGLYGVYMSTLLLCNLSLTGQGTRQH